MDKRAGMLCRMLIVTALCASSSVAAEIYRWKDKDGQTVFSQTPPPDAAHQVVKPKFGKESPAALEKLRAQSPPASKPAPAEDKKQKPQEPTAEERAANCAKARETRTQLETSRRLRIKDEKGELSYLTEEERQKRLIDADKSIQSWCK